MCVCVWCALLSIRCLVSKRNINDNDDVFGVVLVIQPLLCVLTIKNIEPVELTLIVLSFSSTPSFPPFLSFLRAASFYGLSYIRLPLQETKNSTDLEFRFKTHQLNAFLFLAAGTSDYFLVFLEAGQLAVS